MGYYLSRRNQKILAPYLKILESSKQDVTFNTSNPAYLHSILRSAFNTTHPHLKSTYSIKKQDGKVVCVYLDVQIELELPMVEEEVNMYKVAEHILSNSTPIQFNSVDLKPEDLDSLESLAESKNLVIHYDFPTLKITHKNDN